MPLTRPIPEDAMPVVEIIRREVPRPRELPVSRSNVGDLLRFGTACPMGLCPKAETPTPAGQDTFGYDVKLHEIWAFFDWWDNESDPQAAVDAVWPREDD